MRANLSGLKLTVVFGSVDRTMLAVAARVSSTFACLLGSESIKDLLVVDGIGSFVHFTCGHDVGYVALNQVRSLKTSKQPVKAALAAGFLR